MFTNRKPLPFLDAEGPSGNESSFVLFQPDVLLPAQYLETLRRRNHLEPEKKLMLAILEDAISCYQHCVTALRPRGQALCRDAEEWIFEEGSDWLFSFENICEALGFNPTYLRKGLAHQKARALTGQANLHAPRLTPIGERRKKSAGHNARGRKLLKAVAY